VSSRTRWLIVWGLAFLPLAGWWLYGLLDVDEGFYAAVVAEMNRRGEWITPFYNGKPWFEKPILLYWLAKPSLLIFGEMIGPRLPSVATALGTYGVIAWFGVKRFNSQTAQLAVLILASSLLVIGTGRMMMTDMPLLVCFTGALALFWESLVGNPKARIGTAALLGCAVLAKGPVALILFSIIAGWTFWREPDLRKAYRGQWLIGTLVLFGVISLWYFPAYKVNGQLFVQKFLIEQNIGRFTGGDAAHTLGGIQGLIFYVPLFLVGMLPWSLFIWKAWPMARRKQPEFAESEQLQRYLATWAGVIFVFFTISSAKLPHYILPMFPPAALLVADYVNRKARDTHRWFNAAATACILTSAIANGVFIFWYKASGQREVHAIARYVRREGGQVAMYQMGRRNLELGTGKLKLQETSLPSVLLYLNSTALDTDKLDEILAVKDPIWIITREDRIQPEDYIQAQKAGRRLAEVKPPVEQDHFKLYLVK